jgi:response regulator RpfG family c-di-GMP phosphodiesterase
VGNRRDRTNVVHYEISVAGLAAMNSADQPTPEECREIAEQLREMAQQARLPEITVDLLNLAARFERMAALLEASRGSTGRKD